MAPINRLVTLADGIAIVLGGGIGVIVEARILVHSVHDRKKFAHYDDCQNVGCFQEADNYSN